MNIEKNKRARQFKSKYKVITAGQGQSNTKARHEIVMLVCVFTKIKIVVFIHEIILYSSKNH